MKKWIAAFILLLPLLLGISHAQAQESNERVIVVFKETTPQQERQRLIQSAGGTWQKELKLINAASVTIPSPVKEAVKRDTRVVRVDPDVEVFALERLNLSTDGPTFPPLPTAAPVVSTLVSIATPPAPNSISTNPDRIEASRAICDFIPTWPGCPTPTPSPTPTPTPTSEATISSQTVPWGVTRISAPSAWSLSRGANVKVAVLDTGIARSHPDLKDNLAGCVNFIQSWKTCEDDNGHGTHVSGIIAARDNTTGVVGVAPLAKLYSLKVLNRQGSGYLSDIIEALDWSVTNGIQVVNMSLGTTSDVQSFHDAVIRVSHAGISQVAAAGNSGPGANTVNYPGAYPEVIGVAATDSLDFVPSWSSRGPQVDIAAPGVSIRSTYLKFGYKELSGTSMASPHVAATAALRLFIKPGTSPSQMRIDIQSTASPLPFDTTLVGAGLVNAHSVVTAP